MPPQAASPTPPPIDEEPATETLWRVYAAINEWIRFADTKAGAILAADVFLVAESVGQLKDDDGKFLKWAFYTPDALCVLIGILFLVISAALALNCIRPRTRVPKNSPRSLLYFGHIAEFKTPTDYATTARTIDRRDTAYDEISHQVWINSRVARSKHQFVAWSVVTLGLGLLCLLIAWLAAII